MTRRSIVRSLAIIAGYGVAVAIGLAAMRGYFQDQVQDLHSRHRQNLFNLGNQWAQEASEQQRTDTRADHDRLQERHQEMIQAFGGPAAAAAKNPDVDIRTMLSNVADACTGTEGSSHVTVERFTDFTITVDMDSIEGGKSVVQLARCLLTHTATYVSRVQFNRRGFATAGLDRQAIESIADWATASPDLIASLFAEQEFVPENRDSTSSRRSVEEQSNQTLREQQQRQAIVIFQTHVTNAVAAISRAIRDQDAAVDLSALKTLRDAQSRNELLQQTMDLLVDSKRFFDQPAPYYREAMVTAGLDRLYIEAELRSSAILKSVRAPLALAVIERAQERGRVAATLLQVMSQALGEWSYDPRTQKFTFQSGELRDNYRRAGEALQESTRQLDTAMTAWARKGP